MKHIRSTAHAKNMFGCGIGCYVTPEALTLRTNNRLSKMQVVIVVRILDNTSLSEKLGLQLKRVHELRICCKCGGRYSFLTVLELLL